MEISNIAVCEWLSSVDNLSLALWTAPDCSSVTMRQLILFWHRNI
jgi:hypothetical protein